MLNENNKRTFGGGDFHASVATKKAKLCSPSLNSTESHSQNHPLPPETNFLTNTLTHLHHSPSVQQNNSCRNLCIPETTLFHPALPSSNLFESSVTKKKRSYNEIESSMQELLEIPLKKLKINSFTATDNSANLLSQNQKNDTQSQGNVKLVDDIEISNIDSNLQILNLKQGTGKIKLNEKLKLENFFSSPSESKNSRNRFLNFDTKLKKHNTLVLWKYSQKGRFFFDKHTKKFVFNFFNPVNKNFPIPSFTFNDCKFVKNNEYVSLEKNSLVHNGDSNLDLMEI
ncbi:hypothetical protein HK099_006653 [Clydaea vesicula]|uniref:Uncharacterized protein n=1 Tax=Clydaea vesicula TaxID=447962 RepID=A0AAD5XY43_9FUNG|nr:hypothetical protein HK099_006653 [Clydaea vesicula]KAJ3381889.1 hypothetical protein HDU92_005082 [Lobulomyces angularis]